MTEPTDQATKRRPLARLGALTALALGLALAYPMLSFFRGHYQTALERESSSPAVNGLRVRIKSLRRQGGSVRMAYVFERTAPGGAMFDRRFGFIRVRFWGADGEEVGGQDAMFLLTNADFCFGGGDGPLERLAGYLAPGSRRFEGQADLMPPPGAKRVSFELGPHRATKKVPLPD